MSESESDFNLSSEEEEGENIDDVEEESDEEYYPPELREKLFSCTTTLDLPINNSQKKIRIRKTSKERAKSLQVYIREKEEEKEKQGRRWTSGRIGNRKRSEGKIDNSKCRKTRKFAPRKLPYPPPLNRGGANKTQFYKKTKIINIDDGQIFPTLKYISTR